MSIFLYEKVQTPFIFATIMPRLLTLLPLLLAEVQAAPPDGESQIIEAQWQQSQTQTWLNSLKSDDAKPRQSALSPDAPVFNQQTIRQDPTRLAYILTLTLNQNQPELLAELTQAYAQTPHPNPNLLARAQGMVAAQQGQMANAIQTYRDLAEIYPDDARIRLDLGAMEQADHQYREAKTRFESAQQMPDLPSSVRQNIERQLAQIARSQQWQIHASFNPQYEQNINNAAPEYCTPLGCTREAQEKGWGISYQLSLRKQTAIKGHHSLIAQANILGQSYYLSRQSAYDYAIGRISAGWQWQNTQQSIRLLPFYQYRLSGSNAWQQEAQDNHTLKMRLLSHSMGLRGEYRQNIGLHSQLQASLEAYQQRYRSPDYIENQNGRYYQQSLFFARQISAQHLLYAGISFSQFMPEYATLGQRTNPNGYRQSALSLGWQADWQALGGLHSELGLYISHRRYRGLATTEHFTPYRRYDQTYQYSITLSHPKIRLWGFEPQLQWQQSHTQSTHAWAKRHNQQLSLQWQYQF